MTTIIAVRGVGIYSDSKCTSFPNFSTPKLHRVGKAVMGGCGDLRDVLRFVDWVKSGTMSKFKVKREFGALLVSPHGIRLFDGDYPGGFEVLDEHLAIGSGAIAAMVALSYGASPKKALASASEFDDQTGGKMQFMSIGKSV